jgi:hypothetical protein
MELHFAKNPASTLHRIAASNASPFNARVVPAARESFHFLI